MGKPHLQKYVILGLDFFGDQKMILGVKNAGFSATNLMIKRRFSFSLQYSICMINFTFLIDNFCAVRCGMLDAMGLFHPTPTLAQVRMV